MKSKLTVLMAITAMGIVIGIVTTNIQQVSAPRNCGGCAVFKKLTHEFEKNVINAATSGDPNTIPGLLNQYSQDVLRTFELTPR
jgi:hypothetical protein